MSADLLSTAIDTISRRDAIDRVSQITTQDEALSLFERASASGDTDLQRALTDAAARNNWKINPTAPDSTSAGFARLDHDNGW